MEISWSLVFYTLFVGLGMGAFAFVAITEYLGKAEKSRMAGAIITLVAMVAGGISSALHLGHVERVANVLANLESHIAQELILVIVVGAFVVLYIALLMANASDILRKIVATLGLLAAIALAFMNGLIYVLPSRPAWNTILWPLLYTASAAVLGLFAMYIWEALREGEVSVVKGVNKWSVITLAVYGALIIAYVIYLAMAPFPAESRSPVRLLTGDLAWIFWGGVVAIGLAVPLGMTAWLWSSKQEKVPFLATAVVGLACTFVGAVAIRALMYALGTSIQQFL
jgi:DMSO reductase anchor subunit